MWYTGEAGLHSKAALAPLRPFLNGAQSIPLVD